jgi:hypothetical protein
MFETPLFLLAAAIGSMIPLLLHLMQKRRAQPVPFPTLRFLLAAQKSASRSLRIEHFLLWLLRTLIMVLFGMAFALPVLRAVGGGFLGRAPRDIAIVLDISYSTGYQTGRETVFERMLEMAADLVSGLGESDRFCIYLADERPRPLIAEPIADREAGLAQLRALRPRHGSSRLMPAIAAAQDALFKTAGRRQLELHVLTDNQELAWRRPLSDAENAEGAEPRAEERRLTTFVTLAGVPAPENAAPERIELAPPALFQGSGARLTVRLVKTGTPRETTVTFFVNGEEHARRVITSGAATAEQLVFAVPPLPPGTHIGRIEVPSDNLASDDAFHFLLRVRDRMPTLLVGTENDTFFLRAALRATAGGAAAFTHVAPSALAAETLRDYASIFLCNALPLPGQTVIELERFVQRGGLLVIFPGAHTPVSEYQAWQSLPAQVREIREISRAQARQTMIWNAPMHPVLQSLGDALADPILAIQRVLVLEPLAEGVTPLISLSSELPMLLERAYGDGRVLLMAVTADRIGSSLPLTPFFLPLVAQMVEYGAGLGAAPPFHWGSEHLALDTILPDAAPGLRLFGPQGQPLPVRSAVREGQTALYLEDATEPGVYTMTGDEGPTPVLAINMPREESDLTPLDEAAITALLAPRTVHVATDRETLAALIREHRVGRTYGELLLWILLALLVAEFVYANRLARGRALLTEDLVIDPSGRVRGHVHAQVAEEAG